MIRVSPKVWKFLMLSPYMFALISIFLVGHFYHFTPAWFFFAALVLVGGVGWIAGHGLLFLALFGIWYGQLYGYIPTPRDEYVPYPLDMKWRHHGWHKER
ncbi:MAG: hypothetical protein HY459_02950 [Parcubacteria group bacterium]|nr:hypothetical protein [Parcubacteria group bacterium]